MLSNAVKTQLLKRFNLTIKINNNNKINKHPIITQEESESDSDSDTDSEAEVEEPNTNNTNNSYKLNSYKLNSYTHYADTLNKDIPNKTYDNIHICMYKINTQELHPFIMFLLYKDEQNELSFPQGDPRENIDNVLKTFKKRFEEERSSIEYKGFIEDADSSNVMIILNQSEHQDNGNTNSVATPSIKKMTYNSKWWWALASEIINYKIILSFKINNFATHFLTKHSKLVFLYDNQGIIYETPEVGYYGNYYKKIAAVASLGLSRQGPYSSFGPFYYFSDYTHAMRNAFWTLGFKPKEVGTDTSANEMGANATNNKYITVDDKGRYEKGGIVKFALFAGKTKMLMGRKTDTKDDSSISKDLAETNEFVKAMLKLRDSSAKWTKEYNSIRIGSHDVKLPGKPVIHTNPLIALKEYEQQVPLEYYFVDTSQNVEEENINTAVIS